MKKYFWIVLFAASLAASAQDQPEWLGDSVNSIYPEINPVISPDGQTLYFTRVNHPFNNYGKWDSQDIWFSKLKDDGTWSTARRMPAPFNTGKYNAIYSISSDGKFLVHGKFYKSGKFWKERGLSVITRDAEGNFSKPKALNVKKYTKKNKGTISSAALSQDGTLLLLSFSKRWNSDRANIYLSKLNKSGKKWSKPSKLKDLNTRYSEEAPSFSADNKYIYFSSNRRKGRVGGFDIYFSERVDEKFKKWSTPKLLPDINTKYWDSYYKLDSSGETGYFSTNNAGFGKGDIFRVKKINITKR